jgi:hypothetical protein
MGVTRFRELYKIPSGPDFDLRKALGFQGEFVEQMAPPAPSFPRFTLTGYSALGASGSHDQHGTAYQWAGSMTKIRSAHTLKMGLDFQVFQQAGPNGGTDFGSFSFGPSFTQGPSPTRAGPTSGNALASLLVGMGTGSIGITPRVFTSSNYFAVFVQDDFRASNKLVLNLGLRYDFETGRKDRYDHLSWFDMDTPSPLADQVGLPNLRGGLRFVNVDGNPRRQFSTDKNNFGPRVGFAYSLSTKTVVRSGYGINYTPYVGRATSGSSGYIGFSATTQWVSSIDGITPLNSLTNPYPDGLIIPRGSADGLLTAIGTGLSGGGGANSAFIPAQRVGYVQQWNFGVQREMPWQMAVEVAYIGNKGTKLVAAGGFEENQLPPEVLALGNGLLQQVPNPFFGVIESGALAQARTTVAQLLRRFPHFTALETLRPAAASSIYHALQAGIKRRFSDGVQFSVAYTFGKMIDDSSHETTSQGGSGYFQNYYNTRADRSISLYDTPHNFVIGYVVELPFGRGKSIGSGWSRLTDAFLGGWQANGVTVFRSGRTIQMENSSNNSGSGSAVQRPNVNGDPRLSSDRSTDEKLAEWFDTSVFSQPVAYTFGNAPRVLPRLRSDGTANFDVSLLKHLPLTAGERVRLQIRAEAFNMLNAPLFSPPGSSFGAGNFGVVSGQANAPRQVQLGLKVLF